MDVSQIIKSMLFHSLINRRQDTSALDSTLFNTGQVLCIVFVQALHFRQLMVTSRMGERTDTEDL